MQRRDFLRLSAYGTVMLGVPFIAGCSNRLSNTAIAEPPFLMHFMDKQSIIDTGKNYIKKVPTENTRSILADLLGGKAVVSGSTPKEQVHAFYDAQSVADFKANKTVVVDGWVLSVTEARQCALFSIVET